MSNYLIVIEIKFILFINSKAARIGAYCFYFFNKKVTGTTDPLASLSLSLANPTGSFAIQSEFDNKYVITNLDFI